jgi:intracellular sulfur oxidation DsrE/DsrF family protein
VPRRVTSLVRSAPVALRGVDPVLEANAYALAEAIDLTVVLLGPAVELALAEGEAGADLRALLESGVPVYVLATDLERAGLRTEDVVAGVQVAGLETLTGAVRGAEAVLAW